MGNTQITISSYHCIPKRKISKRMYQVSTRPTCLGGASSIHWAMLYVAYCKLDYCKIHQQVIS